MKYCYIALLALAFSTPAAAAGLLDKLLGNEKFPFTLILPENDELKDELKDALAVQREQSAEFADIKLRERAAAYDRTTLIKLLEARGYFSAEVNVQPPKAPATEAPSTEKLSAEKPATEAPATEAAVDPDTTAEAAAGEEDESVRIRYEIEPGPLYKIARIEYKAPAGIELPPAENLPVQRGQALAAEPVLATQSSLEDYIDTKYCLFEVDVDYRAAVDHRKAEGYLTYTVKDSPTAKFGKPQITGLTSIEESYLRRYVTIKEGECFNRMAIEQTRLNLLQTNLVASAVIDVEPPQNGVAEIAYNITERSHRTITAGLGYDADQGVNSTLGWQHRNFFGRGQILDVELFLSQIEQRLRGELTFPHIGRTGQTLVLHTEATREDTESYESLIGEVGATVSRELRRHTSGSIGAVLEFSRVTDSTGAEEDYALASFPITLEYFRANDRLNPTQGYILTAQTRPFIDAYETSRRFFKTSFRGSTYFTADDWPLAPTLALRAGTGTITGVSLEDVPDHHRYFAGGGGSVRGYDYQSLSAYRNETRIEDGETVIDQVPAGGLSFGEVSVETRFRINDTWGFVLFVDGGYAYADEAPNFGEDFRYGAGIGLRFFTDFAPFRIDLATPLNPRDGGDGEPSDRSVQLYISIGQAF